MERQTTIVYTTDLEQELYIRHAKEYGINCIAVLDVRTAVYVAVGITAQNNKPVIVCVRGSNASRSAFAGLTEAFYRQLPVVLLTFGKLVDYSRELADVVANHFVIQSIDEISALLNNKMPLHIEIEINEPVISQICCKQLPEKLAAVLEENDYIYFSKNIEESAQYRCKKVIGGLPGCFDGGIANVLGASLAQNRHKYVGVFSEEEFKHDINTLGNINANDKLVFIVVCFKINKLIQNYALALGYKVYIFESSNLSTYDLKMAITSEEKSVVLVHGVMQ